VTTISVKATIESNQMVGPQGSCLVISAHQRPTLDKVWGPHTSLCGHSRSFMYHSHHFLYCQIFLFSTEMAFTNLVLCGHWSDYATLPQSQSSRPLYLWIKQRKSLQCLRFAVITYRITAFLTILHLSLRRAIFDSIFVLLSRP